VADINTQPFIERMKEAFQTLDPVRRKQLMIFGGGGALFLVAAILVIVTSDDGKPRRFNRPKKIEYSLFNGNNKPRSVSIDAMAGKINKLQEDMSEIRMMFERQDQKSKQASDAIVKQSEETRKQFADLAKQTNDLYKQVDDTKRSTQGNVPLPDVQIQGMDKLKRKNRPSSGNNIERTSNNFNSPGQEGAPPIIPGEGVDPADEGPKIRIINGSGEESEKGGKTKSVSDGKKEGKGKSKINEFVNVKQANSKTGEPDMFLPAGSILSGTLITGMDAPSANQARNDPFPALLRVKHEAILPNKYRMDIKECFLIASGYGDLSSERALMRAERISCIRRDGVVIETALDAYSVGEDGKNGVRGRVVSKNGTIIANALLSGFISGVSQAFAPQRVKSLNITPGQTENFQYPSPELIAGQAFTGGVKGAAEQIADYYLEFAKNIFPVVEVDAGRKIDFVMIRGVSLSPKSTQNNQQSENYAGNTSGGFNNQQDGYPGNGFGAAVGNAANSVFDGIFGGKGGNYGGPNGYASYGNPGGNRGGRSGYGGGYAGYGSSR